MGYLVLSALPGKPDVIAVGWSVIRLWETDILGDPEPAAYRVTSAIK